MKFYRSLIVFGAFIIFLSSCSKSDTPEPEEQKAPVAAAGKISYKLNGTLVTRDATGYILGANHSFIKWENGGQQLSIDFFSLSAGTFSIATGTANAANTAKITWYPDAAANSTVWVARSGSFVVSTYTTPGYKVTGTFSASLEKSVNGTFTGEKMEITEGSFTEVTLRDAR